ncbi:MAG: hypothetical protein O2909_03840 [Chloroflexi bacterium]|nr:hypothetical protein [Chloroflexota bacterium]
MSVLARVFEAAGLTTIALALINEHVQKVRPPRALFVPFPFGYVLGRANDPEFQHRVIAAALDLLNRTEPPVLEEFPEDAGPDTMPQASEIQPSTNAATNAATNGTSLNAADEVTALRPFYERWVESHGGRTAVGLCGVPQRRFRGVIRFLEAYADGEESEFSERPAELPIPRFIRYCADDLKAFFYEARMAQRAEVTEPELHRWFWGETAVGKLLASIADGMNATEDPVLKNAAYGIAR